MKLNSTHETKGNVITSPRRKWLGPLNQNKGIDRGRLCLSNAQGGTVIAHKMRTIIIAVYTQYINRIYPPIYQNYHSH